MGCDFELIIQVLYGDTWVNVVRFGTKTWCGGRPLCHATALLYQSKGIGGDYHSDDRVAATYNEILVAMGLVHGKEDRALKTRASYHIERDNPSYLYYTKEDFEKLVQMIPYVKGGVLSVFFSNPEDTLDLYKRLMEPVPQWMEMAKTALPDLDEIWMSDTEDGITQTTEKIAEQQEALESRFIFQFVELVKDNSYNISVDVLRCIAWFACPRGTDVRLAWRDDELNYLQLAELASQEKRKNRKGSNVK